MANHIADYAFPSDRLSRKYPNRLPYHWLMLAFALFIVACGATHFMELWTLNAEHPRYWLSGWVKLVTAIASVTTALALPPLIPRILALMESARLSAGRRDELERAYAELNERYTHEHARDLTSMVRELAEAKAAAESANSAKDEFLAALSHELRTPLSPVLLLARDMEQNEDLPTAVRRDFGMIRKNVELEARIIEDLLDLTRISHGQLTLHLAPANVHEVIEDALAILQDDRGRKNIAIVTEFTAAGHHIVGDAVRLQQAFWNVIKNAIKFTSENGKISIRSWNEAGRLRISIADTGLGITQEEMPRIFTAFEQGREAAASRFGGLGLGLSITALLIKTHEGRIWAESEGRDRGATFHIDLPVTTPNAAESATSLPASGAHALRILLVEDHADTRAILDRLMTRWGHTVTPADSVTEARQALARGTFDLLVSDVGLPDGSGNDVIAAFREKSAGPAIAMSGYGMESDVEKTRAAGFAEHIIKPVTGERLKEMLARFSAN